MAVQATPLPVQTVSSGGTLANPQWNVTDAAYAAFRVTSASTAPGLTLFGSVIDSSSTGNFTAVGIAYSTANTVITASSGAITMAQISGLIRVAFGTSAASTGDITIAGSKFAEV